MGRTRTRGACAATAGQAGTTICKPAAAIAAATVATQGLTPECLVAPELLLQLLSQAQRGIGASLPLCATVAAAVGEV